MKHNEVYIFHDQDELAHTLATVFIRDIQLLTKEKQAMIAISGGNTPQRFYRILSGTDNADYMKINWEKIHIFWCDERCVPPSDPDSNYGLAFKNLLKNIRIPEKNIHRIRGENMPEDEVKRYSAELREYVPLRGGLPDFDWVFLGLGEDGHTASIFPGQPALLSSGNDCGMAVHPATGQRRISLTAKTINNAGRITFIVTGASKSDKVGKILKNLPDREDYPASHIIPVSGRLEWYLDKAAAQKT